MKAYICPLGVYTEIRVGEEGEAIMPWSEVCMHMRIADKRMRFRVIPTRSGGRMVQLMTLDGCEFSAPILLGEAGVYETLDGTMYYYRPHDMGVAQVA